MIDKWANFLMNEKLEPKRMPNKQDVLLIIRLCEELARIRGPKIRPHKLKLESRRFVCDTAIKLGIDLSSIKSKKGKMLMGRGLLDAWMLAYKENFDSTFGTVAEKETIRRNIKQRKDWR
jgi:hypothetical protein